MSFYSDLAGTANDILAEFGAAATLTRAGTPTYDPTTGTTTATPTTVSVIAAMFDYPKIGFNEQAIAGSLILQGDKQVFMSAVGVAVPTPGDTLTWQAVPYTVIAVKPLAPAGVNVLHELQVRS